LELLIRSDVVGVSLPAILGFGVSLRGFAPMLCALRERAAPEQKTLGLDGEGVPRMDRRWGSTITYPCKKYP